MERAPYEHKCCHQIIHALFEDFSFIGVIFHNYFVPLQLLNDISDMAIGITEELAKLRLVNNLLTLFKSSELQCNNGVIRTK